MSEPEAKKRKTFHNNKSKNYYIAGKSKKYFIEPGQRGFLATCNFREKDCVRECYNILNQYADQLYGPQNNKSETGAKSVSEDSPSTSSGDALQEATKDNDILDDLAKDISTAKAEAKEQKFRFQAVDTETSNCIFIKTTLDDPVELGAKIAKDIAESKVRRTRFLLRLVPISIVCRANMKDIVDTAGTLFDKHFLRQSHTYSIIFNRRYNNNIKRDDVIKELADLVAAKNIQNKVDLKNPELSVIVEIIKGLCCLSVVPDYIQLKKYNLVELAGRQEEDVIAPKIVENLTEKPECSEEKISGEI